jgi:hypothetical protein
MSLKVIFKGQAVKSDLVTVMLEKWGLHPVMEETSDSPDLDDLERDSQVLVPEAEYDRAQEIMYGESEIDRAEF